MNGTMMNSERNYKTRILDVPDEPLSVEPLVDILRRKLRGEKGIARKWLKNKIKQITH
jgi:hypothetical protein